MSNINSSEEIKKMQQIFPNAKLNKPNEGYINIIAKRHQYCVVDIIEKAKIFKYNIEISGFTEKQLLKVLKAIKECD